MTSARTFVTQQSGGVLTVRFDSPPLNLLGEAMFDDLYAIVRRLERDPSVRVVVLTGRRDGVFVTHADTFWLQEASERFPLTVSARQARAITALTRPLQRVRPIEALLRRTPARDTLGVHRAYDLFRRMNRSEKVFVAAINGVALGGGCILALACDLRLMADDDYRIGLPEVGFAFVAGLGGTQRLVRMLGSSRAIEMLLDGHALSATEAAEIGLVHRVVAPDALADEVAALAGRLARRPPYAVRAAKRLVYDQGTRPLRAALKAEEALTLAAGSLPIAGRIMTAYNDSLRRRDPADSREVLELFEPILDGTVAAEQARQ